MGWQEALADINGGVLRGLNLGWVRFPGEICWYVEMPSDIQSTKKDPTIIVADQWDVMWWQVYSCILYRFQPLNTYLQNTSINTSSLKFHTSLAYLFLVMLDCWFYRHGAKWHGLLSWLFSFFFWLISRILVHGSSNKASALYLFNFSRILLIYSTELQF